MSQGFESTDNTLQADGVALARIAAVCGTPCYVYSSGQLDRNVERLKTALRRALPASNQPLIAFACKANSNLGVLNHLAGLGLGADVVSGGELVRAQAAGIDPARIVFSGVGKSDEDIEYAIRAHVAQINIESAPELERVVAIAQQLGITARVAFRLNPDVDAQTHAKITTGKEDNKFGLPAEVITPLYRQAAHTSFIDVQGLSVHIGSQLTTLAPFREAFSKIASFARQLAAEGLPLRSLDLGGGLGIVYDREQAPCLDGYAELIRELISPLGVKIILEPGRLLVGDAGLLLARVTYIKKTKTRQYMVLDAGMNDLVRPALYEAWHEIRPVVDSAAPPEMYDVVGPVCETGDTFARDRALPPLLAGDLLAIMNAGAYGFAMASRYNTRPLPAEVMTRNGHFRVIRHRENIRDILEEEAIPAW
ncbi:MAG: diaminopimelate decarboxylase [Alphaproteobacteria bacterium]|nr:diaminopimelate decarboxylase [Alphaproteobacteria bacterium]